jgi:serine/threonine protein kinase
MLDENGIAKIGDFGSAIKFPDGNDTVQNTSGTYQFFSPECCDRNKLTVKKLYSRNQNFFW